MPRVVKNSYSQMLRQNEGYGAYRNSWNALCPEGYGFGHDLLEWHFFWSCYSS